MLSAFLPEVQTHLWFVAEETCSWQIVSKLGLGEKCETRSDDGAGTMYVFELL